MSLIERLRALPPNGWSGLEGLVAQLLGEEFGLRAVPEPSGAQHGRDIGLIDMKTGQAAPIDIEVKRYQGGNSLNRRELLGELTETRRARPQTELWTLVATVPVAASLVDDLQDEAFRNGFDLLILDCAPNGVSALEMLLARHEAVALAWLGHHRAAEVEDWRSLLAIVRDHPAYAILAHDLEQQLRSRYAPRTAQAAARIWLTEHVEGRRVRIDGMNQALGRAGHAPTIARARIAEGCRSWLEADRSETGMLALLGAEGDGKTWAAIDLLMSAEARTPLIVTSNMFDDGGGESLIAKALARYCGGEEDRWRARLVKSGGRLPSELRILLLIDGLNEAPHRDMDSVLIDLLNGPWGKAVDIVVTCRTLFWTQRVEPYLRSRSEQIDTLEIGPFDYEEEWPAARDHLGKGVGDLPPATVEALRNPRLWSFAYDLKDQLGGIEEITLERLLVEHWRLRYAERGDLRVGPLEFNRLIASAAQRLQDEAQPNAVFEAGDLDGMLRRMLPGVDSFDAALGELRDGVFFTTTGTGSLKLRTDRVPASLGMLLARNVIEAGEINPHPEFIRRAAAIFLDDLPASDRVELIIRTAIVTLLSIPGDHSLVLPTLLRHWVTLQNFESDFYRALSIVVGAAPLDTIRAIEDEAGEDEFVGDAAGELVSALIGRRDRNGMADLLIAASERWLSSYSGELMPGLDTIAAGLIESPVRWIAALDDWATALLAHLSIDRWPQSLANWARRRVAMETLYPGTYRYDQELRWLGLSGSHSSKDLAELIDQADILLDPATPAERQALEQILSGEILAEWSRAVAPDLNATRWDEIDTMLTNLAGLATGPNDPVPFLAVYRDESSNSTEHWLQLERALLEESPATLPELVREQLRQAEAAVEDSEVGGFAQFARDHGLLLGKSVQSLVRRYVERARSAQDDRGGRYFAGRAIPALFFGAEPAAHLEILTSIGSLDAIEKVDLTGFVPDKVGVPDRFDDQFATWLATLRQPVAIPATLRERLIAMLFDEGARTQWLDIARALRLSCDPDVARAIAASGLDAASLGGTGAGQHLSFMILEGTEGPRYADLRRRIAAIDLGAAAARDGSPEAAALLTRDFDALLGVHAGTAIGLGAASKDFRTLSLARIGDRRGRGAVSTETMALTNQATRDILEAISRHQPDYVARLCLHLESVSDGAFAAAERATFLVSILAEGLDSSRAHAWMMRLVESDHGLTNHHGLLVGTPLIFAFTPGRDAEQLRNDLADRAWNDADLVHLVCAAELGGFDDWLEKRIADEELSDIRSRRVRAVVLRGWRGSEKDLEVLESRSTIDGYERFFAEIAGVRARRRIEARALIAQFECADTDADAWLAYRALIHRMDRRLYVDTWRRSWPHALSRQRALAHSLALADDERLFRRIEGDLSRAFGGVVHPTQIPPWSVIEAH